MTRNYAMLALNLILGAVIMYLAMFTMIWSFADFLNNLNMAYMALIMWAPMGVVMLLTMASMYQNRRLNLALYAGLAIVFVAALVGVRQQCLIGDRQFLTSMIPHHSGAVLMCERAQISDAEIKRLCGNIIRSQAQEIAQMKTILARL
jgi:hypothetical protein